MGEESHRKVVLVTGGAGYIGSHVVLELLATDRYQPVVLDNYTNSSAESLHRVEKLSGKKVSSYDLDLLDIEAVRKVFREHCIQAVIHLAGLKAVGESMEKPLLYYHTNLNVALNLLKVMGEFGVKNMVFSSSATVYGVPQKIPIDEHHPVGQGCANPYGRTKYFVEEIMKDVVLADPSWNVTLLRYFNPVGAHKSGEIGEDPRGVPNNLMPYISQVLVGTRSMLSVYGNDYDTRDGTGVRDYIHVVDLAQGHVSALEQLQQHKTSTSSLSSCRGLRAYNLGTGRGVSVLELVGAMEKVSGRKVPYKVVGRRAGDVGNVVADSSRAREELGWTAGRGLEEMCEDTWRWQSKNPKGYTSSNS